MLCFRDPMMANIVMKTHFRRFITFASTYWVIVLLVNCSSREPTHLVFDIPNLINKNIKEINRTLGAPVYTDNPFSKKWEGREPFYYNFYRNEGHELMISYNPYSGEVVSILLNANKKYSTLEQILKIGNLDTVENDVYDYDLGGYFVLPNEYQSITVYPVKK